MIDEHHDARAKRVRIRTTWVLEQQTGLALQASPLPTPTTEIGEQFMPTSPVRSPMMTPNRASKKLLLAACD
ncbi:hypothetical protein PHLCEN_2v11602 [Hermanssonia centrifuga]|uniref:Uncharacterized protein n=1 Tax=Hermanssonia centrifuga TaxID=98765 RepID=A0A2R6NKI8_9APHY|nr:hypothetical protein PHLCEN_2v11602 [Hermanssonia centrifuga]